MGRDPPPGSAPTGHLDRRGLGPHHNRRASGDYLVVAVGRDYSDVAPLSGSYEGNGATNTLAVDKRLDVT